MESIVIWQCFFEKAFARIKNQLNEQYRVEEDGSGPPEIVAIRELVNRLPCAVRVLMLKVDRMKFPHLQDDTCPLLGYDFTRMGKVIVDYLGLIDANDKARLTENLTKHFQLQNAEKFVVDFCKDFLITGIFDTERPETSIHFFFYDPTRNLDEFVRDFILQLDSFFAGTVRKKYEKVVDYNKVFNLKPGPIYPAHELLEQDQRVRAFVRLTNGDSTPITIEDLQADVASTKLIPPVPENVKRVFERAKELYIFGYFRYDFFTISRHYAYLALESAIKNRYYQSFGREVILSNRKGKHVKIGIIDHQTVIDFCYRNRKDGWNEHMFLADGRKFAFTKKELLDWLVQNKIITMWERRVCEHGLRLRDFLSHQTFSPVDVPGWAHRSIEEVAALINKMFLTQGQMDQSSN